MRNGEQEGARSHFASDQLVWGGNLKALSEGWAACPLVMEGGAQETPFLAQGCRGGLGVEND